MTDLRPEQNAPTTFLPRVQVRDELGAYWLRQVTLRLRREVCWLWQQRDAVAGLAPEARALLEDPLVHSLDLARFDGERHAFFHEDETARYLGELIAEKPPDAPCDARAPGSFGDLAARLELAPVDCFVLALALSHAVDSAIGNVLAACASNPAQRFATLSLAQRLWDAPEEVSRHLDPAAPLARHGILSPAPGDWELPLSVPAPVACQLLLDSPPSALCEIQRDAGAAEQIVDRSIVAARLEAFGGEGRLQIVPINGPTGAPSDAAAAELAHDLGLGLARPHPGLRAEELAGLLTLAWMRGSALFLSQDLVAGGDDRPDLLSPHAALPLLVFVAVEDTAAAQRLPPALTRPTVTLRALGHGDRMARWREGLPAATQDPMLNDALAECARRFRYESAAIDRVCAALQTLDRPLEPTDLYAACRADVDLGSLGQPVTPRFSRDELILAPKQSAQVDELIEAAGSLARVHYEWETARAWNEAGISALFAGAPGTGKTMAAEAIAAAVDMPLYRIDLSQVVSKYIGETEKNLRRLFDAADASDVILFFDEADALFGKRTSVKDSHDRYANLEISYLLERMERFTGLAILATNRKRDLDEAFLRRLRYVIDFPQPGPSERLVIWQMAMPKGVDASELDLPFLADSLPLAGGHIRSIVLKACLQSARPGAPRRLSMRTIVRAARDELEKLGRPISRSQFGVHARHLDERGRG